MAEILIQWTSPEAARYASEPSLRRRGDIREVGPNDHTWGINEDYRKWLVEHPAPVYAPGDPFAPANPPEWTPETSGFPNSYRVIRVNGISAPNMRKLLRRWTREAVEGDPEFDAPDPEDRVVEEHRYAWRVNIRELPAPKRAELRDIGYTTLTKNQFIDAAVHKALFRSFDDADPDGLGAPRLPGTVD